MATLTRNNIGKELLTYIPLQRKFDIFGKFKFKGDYILNKTLAMVTNKDSNQLIMTFDNLVYLLYEENAENYETVYNTKDEEYKKKNRPITRSQLVTLVGNLEQSFGISVISLDARILEFEPDNTKEYVMISLNNEILDVILENSLIVKKRYNQYVEDYNESLFINQKLINDNELDDEERLPNDCIKVAKGFINREYLDGLIYGRLVVDDDDMLSKEPDDYNLTPRKAIPDYSTHILGQCTPRWINQGEGKSSNRIVSKSEKNSNTEIGKKFTNR